MHSFGLEWIIVQHTAWKYNKQIKVSVILVRLDLLQTFSGYYFWDIAFILKKSKRSDPGCRTQIVSAASHCVRTPTRPITFLPLQELRRRRLVGSVRRSQPRSKKNKTTAEQTRMTWWPLTLMAPRVICRISFFCLRFFFLPTRCFPGQNISLWK